MVARWQLLELGLSRKAIEHRLATGRLHPIYPGVYAVGRRQLSREGRWMAAILACGAGATLSHESAATAWNLATFPLMPIHVSIPQGTKRRLRGIELHRRKSIPPEHVHHRHAIPLSSVPWTLVDLAQRYARSELENMINAADKHNLSDPEHLRASLDTFRGYPGVRTLRQILDRRTFTLTDSHLERLFIPIARAVGLPSPLTQAVVNGYRVDFYWPVLRLVVETDGLRYHRTPAQQATDRRRDQAHVAAGLVHLRFTHAQVRYERAHVESVLRTVTRRLSFD